MNTLHSGVQHRYLVQAYTDANIPIHAQYRVELVPARQSAFRALTPSRASELNDIQRPDIDPLQPLEASGILQSPRPFATYLIPTSTLDAAQTITNTRSPGDLLITALPESGASAGMRITVEGDGLNTLAGTRSTRSIELSQILCENPWPTPQTSPTTGEPSFPFIDHYGYAKQFLRTPYENAGVQFVIPPNPEDTFAARLGAEVEKGRFHSFTLQYCRDGVGEGVVTADQFNCVGERCSDDEDPTRPGNQHRFRAEAYDENGNVVTNVDFTWASSQNVNVASVRQGVHDPSQIDVTSIGNGESVVSVSAVDKRTEVASGDRKTVRTQMPVTVRYNQRSSQVLETSDRASTRSSSRFRIAASPDPTPTPLLAGVRIIGLPKLLPELELLSVDLPMSGRRLKQFLFHEVVPTQSCVTNADCQRGTCNTSVTPFVCTDKPAPGSTDVIALTIMKNDNELSPARWYLEPGNIPNPTATRATRISTDCQRRELYNSALPAGEDCVYGIQEGSTRYMTMARIQPSEAKMSTYLLTVNSNAGQAINRINEQLYNSWKFAVNIASDTRVALKRDVRRAADLRDMEVSLVQYKDKHGRYPQLEAGSYIRGQSYSVWPSWRETLGSILETNPPLDPINRFLGCNRPFDPVTCWNEAVKQFQCPVTPSDASPDLARDHVYTVSGVDTYLGTRFEVWGPGGIWPRTTLSPFKESLTGSNSCKALNMKLP